MNHSLIIATYQRENEYMAILFSLRPHLNSNRKTFEECLILDNFWLTLWKTLGNRNLNIRRRELVVGHDLSKKKQFCTKTHEHLKRKEKGIELWKC